MSRPAVILLTGGLQCFCNLGHIWATPYLRQGCPRRQVQLCKPSLPFPTTRQRDGQSHTEVAANSA
eukprot:395182-Pelagomonas_calceolata.AAC.1